MAHALGTPAADVLRTFFLALGADKRAWVTKVDNDNFRISIKPDGRQRRSSAGELVAVPKLRILEFVGEHFSHQIEDFTSWCDSAQAHSTIELTPVIAM